MMEYYNFDKWEQAVLALKEYDTYGCCLVDWMPPHCHPFYEGNFWWSKLEYIAKLPVLSETEKKDKYRAESWLLQRAQKRFSPFDTTAYLYECPLYASFFKENQTPTIKEYLEVCYYHYRFLFHKILKKYSNDTENHTLLLVRKSTKAINDKNVYQVLARDTF